jgi:hypothetical protein
MPRDCHFVVVEGGDYGPIQQSYELRKLRVENLRLKERLRACKGSIDDENERTPSVEPPSDKGPLSRPARRPMKQKRFRSQEWSDSIYFGSPALANVITEVCYIMTCQQRPPMGRAWGEATDLGIVRQPKCFARVPPAWTSHAPWNGYLCPD